MFRGPQGLRETNHMIFERVINRILYNLIVYSSATLRRKDAASPFRY